MSSPENSLITRVANLTCSIYQPHATLSTRVLVGTYRCAIQDDDGHSMYRCYIPAAPVIRRSWVMVIGSDDYRIVDVVNNARLNRVARLRVERRDAANITVQSKTEARTLAGDITRTWSSGVVRFGWAIPVKTQRDAVPAPTDTQTDVEVWIYDAAGSAAVLPAKQLLIDGSAYQVLSVDNDRILARRVS